MFSYYQLMLDHVTDYELQIEEAKQKGETAEKALKWANMSAVGSHANLVLSFLLFHSCSSILTLPLLLFRCYSCSLSFLFSALLIVVSGPPIRCFIHTFPLVPPSSVFFALLHLALLRTSLPFHVALLFLSSTYITLDVWSSPYDFQSLFQLHTCSTHNSICIHGRITC